MTDPQPPAFTLAWLAPESVKAWLRLNDQDTADDDLVRSCCALTEVFVQRQRPEFLDPASSTYEPDAEVYQGAVMYASREVRRRNSPSGVQVFGDAGVSFVSRFDSDIERALHMGAYAKPAAGAGAAS